MWVVSKIMLKLYNIGPRSSGESKQQGASEIRNQHLRREGRTDTRPSHYRGDPCFGLHTAPSVAVIGGTAGGELHRSTNGTNMFKDDACKGSRIIHPIQVSWERLFDLIFHG